MQLEASGVACVRGGREVFSGLGFAVASGEALLVSGPNGAGKSSLLRMVAGLVRTAGGRMTLAGGDADKTIAEQAHYLGHQDALKPSLTVAENLAFWARYFGSAASPGDSLAAVGLETLSGLPAGYLSAGQRRRLSMARLLAARRPIWLLDEPTTGLDRAALAILADIMRQHLAGGGLIVAASHGPTGVEHAGELKLGAQA